jgi:hypothetical protein
MASFQDGLKDYVDVAERIAIFREKYPNGSLQPANLNQPLLTYLLDGKNYILYTACAYRTPDDTRPGVGIAWELVPGATSFTRGSEAMNAETAAWGRAIVAVLAADTKRGVASKQEVQNSKNTTSSGAVDSDKLYFDFLTKIQDATDEAVLTYVAQEIIDSHKSGKIDADQRNLLQEVWKAQKSKTTV